MHRAQSQVTTAAVLLLLMSCGPRTPEVGVTRPVPRPLRQITAPPPPPLPSPPAKPNILLVSIDTLRFDATSLDDSSHNVTPFLRDLRTVGINFSRCYSTHDSTPPSHFSMLTGFVNAYQTPIDTPDVSIASQLHAIGYRTFGVAANGNLSQSSMRCLVPFRHFNNLYDEWQHLDPKRKQAALKKIDARLSAYGYETNEWNRMMVFSSFQEVMKRAAPELARSQPFFGFLNILDVHDPYLPDPHRYDRARKEGGRTVPDMRFRPLPPELTDPATIQDPARRKEIEDALRIVSGRAWSTSFDLSAATIDVYRRRYLAEVRDLDESLRGLFAELSRDNLTDSTIVIITSDHGESFGEKHFMTHSLDDSGDMNATHRVPLLIIFPRAYGFAGRAIDEPCTIADLPPTLYALLGIDADPIRTRALPGMFGRSLLALLSSDARGAVSKAVVTQSVDQSKAQSQDDEARRRLRALGYIH